MAKKKKAISKRKNRTKLCVPELNAKSFKDFYECLKDAILVVDNSGTIIYGNSSVESLTGYGKKLEKLNILDLFKFASCKKVESAIQIVFQSESSAEQSLSDLQLTKKNGRKLHVDFSIKHLERKGSKFFVISIHDLSEMIMHQDEKESYLKELNHMSKLADIGRLTAGVAHELNNPLMIIQGFAENIQMLYEEGNVDEGEVIQQIDPIVKASDRMAKIIATMMKLSRDDDVYMVHVDLIEVIEDTLFLLKSQLRHLDITVEKDFESNVGIVNCDPNQIEQIVLNVLNNAIHALEKNDVDSREIQITIAHNKEIELKIWNNGPPIPKELKDRIMSPFFTTKGVGEGTGLGLFLSYGIMKAHDGDLTFESSESEGTEFTLRFPVPNIDKNVIISSKAERTFLVVDDEEFIRDLLSHKLTRYGYRVLQAQNGKEALTVIEKNPDIECVITDLRMPIMDGTQFIKLLRQKNHKTLIYAISGYAGRKSLEMKVKRLGINGFITKPIDHILFSKIVNEIEEHLNYIYGKSAKVS